MLFHILWVLTDTQQCEGMEGRGQAAGSVPSFDYVSPGNTGPHGCTVKHPSVKLSSQICIPSFFTSAPSAHLVSWVSVFDMSLISVRAL